MTVSPIRYPGSKDKLHKLILARIPAELLYPLWADSNKVEYREPFFGSGAIGFRVLDSLPPSCSAWLNDADYGLICLWNLIKNDVDYLIKRIESFTPNVDDFELFKSEDSKRDIDPNLIGFRKLALHQMSFSGMGVKAGGPIGGKLQDNELYNISCRWSAIRLKNKTLKLNEMLNRRNIKITCRDFTQLIDNDTKAFLYLDPPYYEMGQILYKHSFQAEDHIRLARQLRETKNDWVLSYDNHPFIRELYKGWADIEKVSARYTISIGKNRKHDEIIISKKTT